MDGQAYFSMRLVTGGSLADYLDRFPSNPRSAVRLWENHAPVDPRMSSVANLRNARVHEQIVNYHCPRELTLLRRQHIGFVFQQAQLLPFLTMEENLRLVGRNAGLGEADLSNRVDLLLRRLDIDRQRK